MSAQNWQMVIGIETHVQLKTSSKMFSASPTEYCTTANSQANELDFGLPGTLPVANAEAVRMAIRFGLAVGAELASVSEFARKHYFYPDLPKGYQISQFENPIVNGGKVAIRHEGVNQHIGLTRAHLEEDAGKLSHNMLPGKSAVDYNRAGLPLLEIVSEPDLRTASETVSYCKALHKLACWLKICDGNMQEGSMRFDVNISLRKSEQDEFGTRCEIKNLNSFRFIEMAINHERGRQAEILEQGDKIIQQTRLFDTASGTTRAMRSKEEAADYRYFPDPDLLPLALEDQQIIKEREAMPELPEGCFNRYCSEFGLSDYDAEVLTAERELAIYFETVATKCSDAKLAANWVSGDLLALCNANNCKMLDIPISAERVAGLLNKVRDGTISGKIAKGILVKMWEDKRDAEQFIADEGLSQISDGNQLEEILNKIIYDNPKQLEQYKAGKDKLLGFFVGQAMKATQGRANPQQLNELALKLLTK